MLHRADQTHECPDSPERGIFVWGFNFDERGRSLAGTPSRSAAALALLALLWRQDGSGS